MVECSSLVVHVVRDSRRRRLRRHFNANQSMYERREKREETFRISSFQESIEQKIIEKESLVASKKFIEAKTEEDNEVSEDEVTVWGEWTVESVDHSSLLLCQCLITVLLAPIRVVHVVILIQFVNVSVKEEKVVHAGTFIINSILQCQIKLLQSFSERETRVEVCGTGLCEVHSINLYPSHHTLSSSLVKHAVKDTRRSQLRRDSNVHPR